jgi:hypothetical protein
MPHALANSAISFGLVTIPVSISPATESHNIAFRQIHTTDGGSLGEAVWREAMKTVSVQLSAGFSYRSRCNRCGAIAGLGEDPLRPGSQGDGQIVSLLAAGMGFLSRCPSPLCRPFHDAVELFLIVMAEHLGAVVKTETGSSNVSSGAC